MRTPHTGTIFIYIGHPTDLVSVYYDILCQVGLVISESASHEVGRGFAPRLGLTKDHYKNGTNCLHVWLACVRVGV